MNGDSIPDFPEIDPISLRNMIGSYQVKLSASYYGDHVFQESGYQIQVGREDKFTTQNFHEFDRMSKAPSSQGEASIKAFEEESIPSIHPM